MPRKRVEPIRIDHNGNVRYRVIIPKELGGGKRFFDKSSDAADFARDLEKQRNGSASEFFALSSADQAALLRAARMLGPRIREAEDAVSNHMKAKSLSDRTLRQAVAEFVKSKSSQGLAPKYVRVVLATLRRFTEKIDDERKLSSITSFEIEDWLKPEVPIAIATRRSYLTDISTFFSWCVKMNLLSANPAAVIGRPRYIRRETKILSVQDCRRLMHTARKIDPGLIPYLALCLFAGIRPDETTWLSWSHVKDKVIEVPAEISKTRRRRLVEIHENLRRWLAMKGDLPAVNVRYRLPRVREVAGVKWPKDCLRHSFASYSCALFGVVHTAHQCGNSEVILQQHYLETCEKKAAKRFFSIVPPKLTNPDKPRKHEETLNNGRANGGVLHVASIADHRNSNGPLSQ